MAGIQAAVDYAGARNTRALVIGHGGHIVFEKYWDGRHSIVRVDLSGFTPVLSALVLGVGDERRAIDQPRCAARRISLPNGPRIRAARSACVNC